MVHDSSSGPAALPERNWLDAVKLGFKGKCPSCGGAPIFGRFLKPLPHCPACGQSWAHQQADDFPAYLVILVLGHLLVPIVVEVNLSYEMPMVAQMLVWPAIALAIALIAIQPFKGAVIAFQWAKRMHGF